MLTAQSAKDFARAQQLAFIESCLSFFRGRANDLLSFETVRQALKLRNPVDLGLQEIELEKIIGSVGKSRDFSRTFLPKGYQGEELWRRVDILFHNQGFEPVDLYKVGDCYFVRDGHHRISVNRTHGVKTIEAYVTAFKTGMPLNSGGDLESFLRRACAKSDQQARSAGTLVWAWQAFTK
jgi:hypothetical protein